MINEIIEGVKFENLPAVLDENGKISYPLNSWSVAELISRKIDEAVKPYVTIDFATVDKKPFLLELNDAQEYDPAEDPEQKIIDYVFGN